MIMWPAEDDYRKVDEWAILQEEIHDPEHFAVPERVGTPQSGKSKRSVSRIEVNWVPLIKIFLFS